MSETIEINCKDCSNPVCCIFSNSELGQDLLIPNFPSYTSNNTCVTNAISFFNNKVSIDLKKCIYCGICQSRCIKNKQLLPNLFSRRKDEKYIISIDKIKLFFSKMSEARKHDAIIPNLITRNLLLTQKIPAAILKKGVTSIRNDLLSKNFLCEIEFNDYGAGDILSIPRSLLDDVAVICSRYGKNINSFRKIAIIDRLPHIRSEYWEVINDIKKVTGVKIETITVLMLLAKIWTKDNYKNINSFDFYIDNNFLDYREKIASKYCPEIDFSNIQKTEELDIIT